jgi:UBX domain-containing protein 7
LVVKDELTDVSAVIDSNASSTDTLDAGAGIFNQRDTQAAVWEDESSSHNQILSFATGGASERSNKAHTLAEMYRPPFEIISRLSFDEARDEGKAIEKWILVNVQDPSIFDCQVLNRDLWKNKDIMAVIKEKFIFLQYAKEDPRGANYINYYFQASLNNQNAYPHIGIVDPRTGEQVKVWSGHPPPEASEFLIQLYDFLDRYSLDPEGKNPVAKRKPERKPELDIDRMTEEQMLEMALQNSLAEKPDAAQPAHDDPDELTKSITLDKGKGKAPDPETNGSAASPWSRIAHDRVHTEPPSDPKTTTRIQFRYSGGRVVRRFRLDDPIIRIYEWLKASPLEGKQSAEFELIFMGRNLIDDLHETIEGAGLKNGSVMVEFVGGEDE